MRIGNVAWSWLDPTVTPKGDQVLEIIDNIKSLGLPCFDMI